MLYLDPQTLLNLSWKFVLGPATPIPQPTPSKHFCTLCFYELNFLLDSTCKW